MVGASLQIKHRLYAVHIHTSTEGFPMRTILILLGLVLGASNISYAQSSEKDFLEGHQLLARSYPTYYIEKDHNDELFIINGDLYRAKTYCLGWTEGEQVIFLEGTPGVCVSAKLLNLNRREKCNVWCE